MLKIVVDTNIIVSSFIKKGDLFRDLVFALRNKEILLVVSWDILEEIVTVFAHPRIMKYTKMDQKKTKKLIKILLTRALIVDPKEGVGVCRDMSDNKFIEAACQGKAKYIITGDKDLLILKSFEGIEIIKLSEFVERILPYAA